MTSRQKVALQQITASRIKILRQAAGLTQEQLAEKAEIAPQYLSRIETARQLPSLDTIVSLAKALNTTPSALLAVPQQDTQTERMNRIAAMFSMLNEEDSAFLESQIAGWVSYIKNTHNKT